MHFAAVTSRFRLPRGLGNERYNYFTTMAEASAQLLFVGARRKRGKRDLKEKELVRASKCEVVMPHKRLRGI